MKTIDRIVTAQAASEGAGVRIYRALGTAALAELDPFLMLDFFGSDVADDYLAGFPDHPHRGFITITYMLDGRMRHRDSMGNEGVLQPGDVQWMKAASGVIHSEMPEQQDGLMRGFQLWLNLPATEKMSDPAYRDIPADTIPVVRHPGSEVRIIAGTHDGAQGAIDDAFTGLTYLDVRLDAGATLDIDLSLQNKSMSKPGPDATERNSFVFVYEGALQIDGAAVANKQLATLATQRVRLQADGPAAAIVVSGTPLHEPVAKHGPFVMNHHGEIRKAVLDFQQGQLVRKRASRS